MARQGTGSLPGSERNSGAGDVWTFIAIDADTKVISSFVVGKRDGYQVRKARE